MTQFRPKIRLHVDAPLGPGEAVELDADRAHYLGSVMRRSTGNDIALFNGRDGEWRAIIEFLSRRRGLVVCDMQTEPQTLPPDLWLCFAPIKKARTDFIVEKAAELGCRRIVPVFTRHTDAQRVNADRLRAHAVEAAEQCGLLSVPEVVEARQLEALLADWPEERSLMFCDESGMATPAREVLRTASPGPWAVIVGPEGGFTADERVRLRSLSQSHAVALGPRIMRADTAAVAALALWQSVLGDWQ